jgi:hypothetical protein
MDVSEVCPCEDALDCAAGYFNGRWLRRSTIEHPAHYVVQIWERSLAYYGGHRSSLRHIPIGCPRANGTVFR